MIALLASVACCDEIDAALSGGADIIDLKDPSMGALGAWKIELIREAVAKLKGRRPVSATIGDLPMQPEVIAKAVRKTADTGVDIVKIGFFDGSTQACLAALDPIAERARLVAVLFADRRPDFDLLPALANAGFFGVMLDTADKSKGTLCNHMDRHALAQFGALARTHGLHFGLAGSLSNDRHSAACVSIARFPWFPPRAVRCCRPQWKSRFCAGGKCEAGDRDSNSGC